MDWAELLATRALWQRLSEYRDIPAGVALAHVVVAAKGRPVEVAPDPIAELLGPALATLLPAGGGTKRLDLAGPGLGEPTAERVLVLVPVHPQTRRDAAAARRRRGRARRGHALGRVGLPAPSHAPACSRRSAYGREAG
ncbi:hypothetical protein [Streptomyces sp. NPDC058308]|uniref:hypothetical protein n=1 Tax=Streptomyces sp. NPDC058308 TaxID=3346440 RepID=UPI0036E7E2D1